jgi:hypothetical protein
MEDYLKVYVVIEEDDSRGYGATVVGVFTRREDAEAARIQRTREREAFCTVHEEELK